MPGPTTMPGQTNTGVPAGVALRRHTGDIVVTRAGTVLDRLDIYGNVTVKAKGVVIQNSIVRGGVPGKQIGIVQCAGPDYSVRIRDTEIVAQNPSYQVDGIRGWNITAERVNVHHVIDPFHLYGTGNVRILSSWIHDNLHYENDPGWNGGPSHDDSIQIQSGAGFWIIGNRLEHANNAAIQVTQDAGDVAHMMIKDNFLSGGAVTINIAQKARGPFVNIDIVNNLFGPSKYGQQLIRPVAGDINFAPSNARVDGKPTQVVLR